MEVAQRLYDELTKQGIDVLMDDRDESAGRKFNDADLIGIPYRVTIGKRGLQEGKVEIKDRATGVVESVPLEGALARVCTLVGK
jgi:prolyl-tRNA synthetase